MNLKFFFFFFSYILLLALTGCKDAPPGGPDIDNTVVTIRNYANSSNSSGTPVMCGVSTSEAHHDVKVRVHIDRYLGNGIVEPNFTYNAFDRTNDMGADDNVEFFVDVPSSGTYFARVEVAGRECFSCCTGAAGCEPEWSGLSMDVNDFPPPAELAVAMSHLGCF